MNKKERILSNGSIANLISEDQNELSDLWHFSKNLETENTGVLRAAMKNKTYLNILIYDNYIALGVFGKDKTVTYGIAPQNESYFLKWVDTALSSRREPVRVVDRTNNKTRFAEILGLRLLNEWVEYDQETELLKERNDVPCGVYQTLKELPECDELYALRDYDGQNAVFHLKITDKDYVSEEGLEDGLTAHYKFEGVRAGSYEEVKAQLESENPGVLVIKQPFFYCTPVDDEAKPWSCLGAIFERVYAEKKGFDVKRANPGIDTKGLDGMLGFLE